MSRSSARLKQKEQIQPVENKEEFLFYFKEKTLHFETVSAFIEEKGWFRQSRLSASTTHIVFEKIPDELAPSIKKAKDRGCLLIDYHWFKQFDLQLEEVQLENEKKHKIETVPEEEPLRKVIRKGKAAVDEYCPIAANTHVYQDQSCIYEAMLNQTNISRNNNKFYLIQLLQHDFQSTDFYVWRRWGRVGAIGQDTLEEFPSDLHGAKASFYKKFYDKTKNHWEERHSFEHYDGKYDLLQRDFSNEEEEEVKEEKKREDKVEVESQLDARVQQLIKLIFDVSMMDKTMVEIGYDARKMPLGKLSKDHLKKGYEVLKQISTCLQQPKQNVGELSKLSSRFYTLIPHDFGRTVPPIIRNMSELKIKLEMLESLADIQIATNLISTSTKEESDVHPLDAYYHSLNTKIHALNPKEEWWQLIHEYVQKTHAETHSEYQLKILDIYQIEREEEKLKFQQYEKLDNQMLLWHGSRLSNFVGILSKGLRIAPPEAPVTGYMFAKGIYFADMVSKSANYCCTTRSSRQGLLLLCQVALGHSKELMESDYNADQPVLKPKKGDPVYHSVKGCGASFPDPKQYRILDDGLIVPVAPIVKNEKKGSLLYNEYIVYRPEQVQIKFILHTEFLYK